MPSLADDVHFASGIAERLTAAGIDTDDPDYAELLASETDVQDRLRRIVRASRFAAADAKTLGGMMDDMRDRKARLERKATGLKSAALWAMGELGLKRLDAPDMTATITAGRVGVTITDPDALPDDVCVIKREPSKAAIAAWLDEKGACAGAERSNGAPSLTIRTK